MRRREFIAGLAGAAALPLAARAQQPMPLIGYLSGSNAVAAARTQAAFRQGLSESGYVVGQNVAIEYRFADGHYDRLPTFAAELVAQHVAVIVATAGAEVAAKAVTSTIPILFSTGSDPVKSGVVASFNRPGGNATGVFLFTFALGGKRLDMLREAIPKARVIAVLANPTMPDPASKADLMEVEAAARVVGQQIVVMHASTEQEIDAAFAKMDRERADAVLVMADPYFSGQREQIVALAARHAIPACYEWREFAAAGGLMSYGSSLTEIRRQLGVYTGKVLKGAKPAELPTMQAVKVELIINLKTAKVLGLTFPLTLLGRADEVIE